jgi:hypothetical protein
MKATIIRFAFIAFVTLYADFSIVGEKSNGLIDINYATWFL